jgi:hypothetical protein
MVGVAENRSFVHIMPGGRPTKYKSKYVEIARAMRKLDATDSEIAKYFECSRMSLDRWSVEYPEFCEAMHINIRGEDGMRMIRKSLFERAVGYSQTVTKVVVADGVPLKIDINENVAADVKAATEMLKRYDPDWQDKPIKVEVDATVKGEAGLAALLGRDKT